MPMRDLDYQARVLTVFDAYLTELSALKKRADGIAELARQQPDLGLDIPDHEGDQQAHALALTETPNLDIYDLADGLQVWPQIKDSLGNALRRIRPFVVMDEGHKAISELAFATLYGFNPCFVLELTATPKDVAARGGKQPRPARHANILVEVLGTELDREGMIKMPLNLDPRQGTDWRNTLRAALERLTQLDAAARRLHGERGRYIRPILLVQVERTGREQRDGAHIHALARPRSRRTPDRRSGDARLRRRPARHAGRSHHRGTAPLAGGRTRSAGRGGLSRRRRRGADSVPAAHRWAQLAHALHHRDS